jgi:hypothetical protein
VAVVKALQGSEVAPQVLHRLDVVLLLRGEDGVEGLQLGSSEEEEDEEEEEEEEEGEGNKGPC